MTPRYKPSDEFVAALQMIQRAAADFALLAGRDMQRANPERHGLMLEAFESGLGELQVTVQLSPEPHVRLTLHCGTAEQVLFDSIHGAPPPAVPCYGAPT